MTRRLRTFARPYAAAARVARRGFTLLELIISVALVLVVMLAITKIFSITSTTIGASQGFAAATRDARAAQAVFAHDIGSMASNTPWIWIRYDDPLPAFRNAVDEKSDKDYNASDVGGAGTASAAQYRAMLTVDANGDGVEGFGSTVPGEEITTSVPSPLSAATYEITPRNHRQDRFSFCARDRFYRETGNGAQNTLVSNMSSSEAWITYGHLTLPYTDGSFQLSGNSSTPTNPGEGSAQTNPQNFYASQWVLGRAAMLMVLPTGAPSGNTNPTQEYITDSNGIPQEFIKRTATWTSADSNMTPITSNSAAIDGNGVAVMRGTTSVQLPDARYDLVGIDIANAIDRIKRHLAYETANNGTVPWYTNMLATRFHVNPFALKPLNAFAASQQVPVFLPSCSQFIVEFAGDFVTQTPYGTLDNSGGATTHYGLQPDGQIDYHYDGNTGTRQIQWYGLPRSSTGRPYVSATNVGDVVLLSDFVHYITGAGVYNNTGTAAPVTSPYTTFAKLQSTVVADKGNPNFCTFEHWPTGGRGTSDTKTANRALKDAYNITDATNATLGTYYCAWGPDSIQSTSIPRPKLIRITLTLDRPELAGRTADGQTFQYVFNLQ